MGDARNLGAKRRLLFSPESYNLGETTRGIEVAAEGRLRGHECWPRERRSPTVTELPSSADACSVQSYVLT